MSAGVLVFPFRLLGVPVVCVCLFVCACVSVLFLAADKQYRMAVLRGARMTPEADAVRVAMAHAAGAAFDRLARAQVSTGRGGTGSRRPQL